MSDNQATAGRALRRGVVVAVLLAVLGVLADLTGLLGFITGKTLPEIFASPDASAAPQGPQGAMTTTTSPIPPTARSTSPPPPPPPAVTTPPGTADNEPTPGPPGTVDPVITTTDAIKNFQLGVSPGEFDASVAQTIVIETSDGGLGTFVDIEIANPAAAGGVCPKLTSGPCNLIYSGGAEADSAGRARLEFEWFGDTNDPDDIHHQGTYTVTVQDRGTGAKVSIDFTAR